MEKPDSSREPIVGRISSPVAAGAILLGLFTVMSLVAGGIAELLSPQETAAAVYANASNNPSALAAARDSLAGGCDSLPQKEDINAYAD